MGKAFLVAKFVLVRGIPRFRGISIYSSEASQLTRMNQEIYFDVESMDGEKYHDAREKMIEHIKNSWHLEWVRKWFFNVDPSEFQKQMIEEEDNPLNIAMEHLGELP